MTLHWPAQPHWVEVKGKKGSKEMMERKQGMKRSMWGKFEIRRRVLNKRMRIGRIREALNQDIKRFRKKRVDFV